MAKPRLDRTAKRFISRIESIAQTREDWEITDERLSDGQLHYLVTTILKNEPLVVAAHLLYKAGRADSKVKMDVNDQARLALMISDRLYGPVSVKAKRAAANANQFELQFAWDDASGERHKLTATGDIE